MANNRIALRYRALANQAEDNARIAREHGDISDARRFLNLARDWTELFLRASWE